MRYRMWLEEVETLCLERVGVGLDEVPGHSPTVARGFCRDGLAPKDYLSHLLETDHAEAPDRDFDPRYELFA